MIRSSLVLFLFSVFLLSCKSNTISGVYVCDQSGKKPQTTIHHESYDETTLDLTCVVEEYDFKGNSTVVLKMKNGQIASSYVIDKQFIRIKGDKTDFLLERKDKNTLVADGMLGGVYHKK